jgi:hypothetical protein
MQKRGNIDRRSWIMFIAFLTLLSIFLSTYNHVTRKDIEDNFSTTCGILNYYGKTSRGITVIGFEYYHNTIKYKGGGGSAYFKNCDKTGWCLGKCYIVEYSSKHPNNSRMNFDKPCDCDSIIKIDNQ